MELRKVAHDPLRGVPSNKALGCHFEMTARLNGDRGSALAGEHVALDGRD
jgi:hypothetical protein